MKTGDFKITEEFKTHNLIKIERYLHLHKFDLHCRSIIECAGLCSKTRYCSAFNFHPKEKACQLGSIHTSIIATSTELMLVYHYSGYNEKGQ